jgi:hypothetical protein
MFLNTIIWLAIGFTNIWCDGIIVRLARRMAASKNKTTVTKEEEEKEKEAIVTSVRPKVTKQE